MEIDPNRMPHTNQAISCWPGMSCPHVLPCLLLGLVYSTKNLYYSPRVCFCLALNVYKSPVCSVPDLSDPFSSYPSTELCDTPTLHKQHTFPPLYSAYPRPNITNIIECSNPTDTRMATKWSTFASAATDQILTLIDRERDPGPYHQRPVPFLEIKQFVSHPIFPARQLTSLPGGNRQTIHPRSLPLGARAPRPHPPPRFSLRHDRVLCHPAGGRNYRVPEAV